MIKKIDSTINQRFIHYCTTHRLHQSDDKWLVAVSGGIDSMTLAHLCHINGFAMGVAHCNFGLRRNASNDDEQFVMQWVEARNLPFFSIRFKTKEYAAEHGISTQMAARDLRYAWFEELRKKYLYDAIAVAHHADDNAETVLLNLTRGTGIKGLCGIKPAYGRIVRPLLFATRNEITEYANTQHITYREDCTNAKTDYARNRIRHNVIPELKTINPTAVNRITEMASHITKAYNVIETERARLEAAICIRSENEIRISIAGLMSMFCYDFWLFELLQPYNFSGTTISAVTKALNGRAGKHFYSNNYELIKDRRELIIVPRTKNNEHVEVSVKRGCKTVLLPIELHFEYKDKTSDFIIPREKNIACLSADKLQFPLMVRRWCKGDVFVPLGMQGMKKISDFLIDEKIPRHRKDKQYVLVSGKDIVWLIGKRINEKYKTDENTNKILIVKQIQSING